MLLVIARCSGCKHWTDWPRLAPSPDPERLPVHMDLRVHQPGVPGRGPCRDVGLRRPAVAMPRGPCPPIPRRHYPGEEEYVAAWLQVTFVCPWPGPTLADAPPFAREDVDLVLCFFNVSVT
jgi:hypothetical protein